MFKYFFGFYNNILYNMLLLFYAKKVFYIINSTSFK